MLAGRDEIEAAGDVVYGVLPPTPQIAWPLLCERAGCEVWLKQEPARPPSPRCSRSASACAAARSASSSPARTSTARC